MSEQADTFVPYNEDGLTAADMPDPLRLTVTARDGSRYELDPRALSEAPAKSDHPALFSDRRRLQAPLPALEVGAVVEQQIVRRDRRPFFSQGSEAPMSRRFR